MIEGRLGTFDQAKISVYGPRVNLASRFESLTKFFGVGILIDDATAALLNTKVDRQWFRCRRVASVLPHGMTEPVKISELLPPATPGALTEGDRRRYEAALDAFNAGQWTTTRGLLQTIRRDGPSQCLLQFMEQYRQEPPPAWNGVITMNAK